MEDIFSKIYNVGIVPVIKISDLTKAVPLAEALKNGGLNVLEVTFRTDCADQAISIIKENVKGVTLIAGTVLSVENAKKAIASGAEAIVAPGFNPEIVKFCQDNKVPVCPGICTASEIEQAMSFGLDFVKFFPSEASGGIKMIKALSAPYSGMKFMPTGGVDESNILDYLSFDKVVACGGSWMVKEDLIKEGNFAEIERLTRSAVQKTLGIELAHIGINCKDEKQALKDAQMLSLITGFDIKNGNSSIFLSNQMELMKSPYLGKNGHIALFVNNIARATAHFENSGFVFNESSKKYDAKGKLTAIYFQDEIAGFALHLVEKK